MAKRPEEQWEDRSVVKLGQYDFRFFESQRRFKLRVFKNGKHLRDIHFPKPKGK